MAYKIVYETEPCSRCWGSGSYSRCQTWGTTCFKCGRIPGVPGSGKQLSKKGEKARDQIRKFMYEILGASTEDVKVGESVRVEYGGKYVKMTKVSDTTFEYRGKNPFTYYPATGTRTMRYATEEEQSKLREFVESVDGASIEEKQNV